MNAEHIKEQREAAVEEFKILWANEILPEIQKCSNKRGEPLSFRTKDYAMIAAWYAYSKLLKMPLKPLR